MADLSTTRKRQRRNSTLASLNDEITSEELFFPLVLHIVPEPLFETDTAINVEDGPCRTGDKETPDDLVDYENADDTGKSTSPPLTDFDRAITRIESLPSHLTQSMQLNLKSILTVIHTQLMPSPSLTNPLITRVASLDTSPEELVMIAETIDSGLSAFLARGGGGAHKSRKPAPPTPSSAEPISPSETRAKSSSSTRSTIVRTRCAERDHRSCLLTNRRGVVLVSHIIPFSVRDTSATDFWKFIALFRGEAATAALKNAALGAGNSTDTLRNVWCLATDVHEAFDDGRLTVIPQLDETQVPYNPAATSEYTAIIEFPRAVGDLSFSVVAFDRGRARVTHVLEPGTPVVFRTVDPVTLPLPHPLLFQLHAACCRVIAMKAAAGWVPDEFQDDENDISSLCEEETNDLNETDLVWPSVPALPTSDTLPANIPVAEKMPLYLPEIQTQDPAESPRWVSVVDGDYATRMSEMWQKCAQRLGRDVRGIRWWE